MAKRNATFANKAEKMSEMLANQVRTDDWTALFVAGGLLEGCDYTLYECPTTGEIYGDFIFTHLNTEYRICTFSGEITTHYERAKLPAVVISACNVCISKILGHDFLPASPDYQIPAKSIAASAKSPATSAKCNTTYEQIYLI